MAITGLSHATFVVSDLERASRLFREGLGAREVYDSTGREHSLSREKFFVLGGLWLVAMEGPPLAEPSYRHLAFAVDAADIPLFRQRLETLAWRSCLAVDGSRARAIRCTSATGTGTCSSCTPAPWTSAWPPTPRPIVPGRPEQTPRGSAPSPRRCPRSPARGWARPARRGR